MAELYLEQARQNPDRVSVELKTENPYLDGANIIRFLHERYGTAGVQSVLASPSPSFWGAMRSELGLDASELGWSYREWVRDGTP